MAAKAAAAKVAAEAAERADTKRGSVHSARAAQVSWWLPPSWAVMLQLPPACHKIS